MMIEQVTRRYNTFKLRMFIRIKNMFILPLAKIEKHVPKKGMMAELGSGFGMVSIYLGMKESERDILGLELSKGRVKTANDAASGMDNVRFEERDITKDQDMEKKDAFLLIDFLHHVDYDSQHTILDQIDSKLEKGGKIIIKEIEKKLGARYACNLVCDMLMTRGYDLYFRSAKEWKKIFERMNYSVKLHRIRGAFPHIMMVCEKR
jgi:cyclopropane fatty-acyl-phospholipid synthase-like methyltransferase